MQADAAPSVHPSSYLRRHRLGFVGAIEALMIFLHAGLSWLTLRTKHPYTRSRSGISSAQRFWASGVQAWRSSKVSPNALNVVVDARIANASAVRKIMYPPCA